MGQTLTHGVYLPDEGERNCYSGLAANWQILDSSVGTIAAHTAALSGKAPLVHTHTKADITDFPAYGNTAGTICEGNDSRLSDARTPLSHTHTKANITDLLNSDFIPSANNSYNLGTSTNKWKTLNGVNPGALSLPKGYTEEGADKDYIDIASTIQTLDGTLYYYTMPDNGWISVRAEQANQVHVTTDNWKFGQSIYSNTVTTLIVSTPFRKGDTVAIKVRAVTLEHARFYPMQGNL